MINVDDLFVVLLTAYNWHIRWNSHLNSFLWSSVEVKLLMLYIILQAYFVYWYYYNVFYIYLDKCASLCTIDVHTTRTHQNNSCIMNVQVFSARLICDDIGHSDKNMQVHLYYKLRFLADILLFQTSANHNTPKCWAFRNLHRYIYIGISTEITKI